jgi:hypothetical protein
VAKEQFHTEYGAVRVHDIACLEETRSWRGLKPSDIVVVKAHSISEGSAALVLWHDQWYGGRVVVGQGEQFELHSDTVKICNIFGATEYGRVILIVRDEKESNIW